ncbi:MAG TPA: DUF3943 domain-containing protein [Polyangiaceae bacterium]|nr:DUF3943 domain-containing protein [Polyangiaceae bacterium]
MAGLLTIGTSYYWIRPQLNQIDWDFPDAVTRIRNLRASLDSNKFKTNHVLHPLAGSSYYLFAREVDLSPLAAAAYSFGSSAVFEYLLEWLEKVSINDLIFTPGAGIPAGEFVYNLSNYLNSAPAETSWAQDIASYSLGLPSRVHGRPRAKFDSRAVARLPRDRLGFSSAYHHEFHVAIGVGTVDTEAGYGGLYQRLTLHGEIVAMPGFQRPGRFAQSFGQGNFSETRFRYSISDHGMEADAYFQATLFGYYAQNYRDDGRGLTGSAGMLGLGLGYRYHDSQPEGPIDQYAFAHLLGVNSDLWLARRGAVLRLRSDAHLDFGAVRSLPYAEHVAPFDTSGMKQVLRDQGYYFVRGASARLETSLSVFGLQLGASYGLGRYYSIQGIDRFQGEVLYDISSNDTIQDLDAWFAGAAPHSPIELRFDYNLTRHVSQMPPWTDRHRDQRATFSLGLRL